MNGWPWWVNSRLPSLLWLAPLVVATAAALGLLPLIFFALKQGGAVSLDSRVLHVARFTLWQAGLSTLLSVFPAIPLARALARQQFRGRMILLALFAVPMSLPAIVAVLAVVSLYGVSGLLGGWFPVYGLPGILLVHVFFNLPLAAIMLYRALAAVPTENYRLAAQLNLTDASMFRHVDWPAMRAALPRIIALVFLLCAASFVTVLTLGGPAATTLEVAIYQSLRTDFDIGQALSLSAVQVVLSLTLVLLLGRLASPMEVSQRLRLETERFDGRRPFQRLFDTALLVLATLLLLPPLASLAFTGLAQLALVASLGRAIATSLAIALPSALMTVAVAWCLAVLQQRGGGARLATAMSFVGLVLPPAVMATGWYLAVKELQGGVLLAAAMIVCLNIMMALPFAVSALSSGLASLGPAHDKLCQHLGLSGFERLRVADGPALKPFLLQALLLAFALSFGDLTAVTLLGAQGLVTLPSLIAEQLGHFQSRQAEGTALVLAVLCFAASWSAQRFGQQR